MKFDDKDFTEEALLAQHAILRTGTRRIADAMGTLLGTDRLKHTRLPRIGNTQAYGYRGAMKVLGFKGSGEGRKGRPVKSRQVFYLANEKKNSKTKGEIKTLPLGFVFAFELRNSTSKFIIVASSSEPTIAPARTLFQVARTIEASMHLISDRIGKVSAEITKMYEQGAFEKIDAMVDTEILHSPMPVRIVKQGTTYGFEVRIGMGGIGVRNRGVRLGMLTAKRDKEIWLKANPSPDIAQAVYNFYEMTGDLFYRMDSIGEEIAKGMGRKAKIERILKEGLKKSMVFVAPSIQKRADKAIKAAE